MNPERWKRIDEIFHAALEREASSRAAFLAEACKDDDSLLVEVEDLLENHEKQSSLFDRPPTDLAAALLAKQSTFKGAIGHYQIVKKIGSGGMGEVYLAEDTRLNRNVALKILPSEFTQDKDRVRRFEREARAVSGLNHPNILTIYDIGQFDSSSFIASEFIDGETLRQRMIASKLSLQEILTIGIQVAEAIDAAHQAGVIHRDIKPENIMLRKDGYVKVLDFGLAKLAEKQKTPVSGLDTQTAHTQAGIVIGTFRYMSPEQARGLKVDARSDIFSLGIVLYELITGKPPFDGKTSSDILAEILTKDPPAPTTFGNFSNELNLAIKKTLEKEPEDRYQTAKELLTDLKRIQKRLDVDEELRSSEPFAIVQPGRKTKWAVTALLALIAAIVAIYFLYGKASPKIVESIIPFSKIKLTRLTSSGSAWSAVISPDGKYVTYLQEKKGQQILYLNQLATGTEIPILTLPQNTYFSNSRRFSHDGQYFYYQTYRITSSDQLTNNTLYQMPVLGGVSRKLIEGIVLDPALSPDGKKLAFIRNTEREHLLMIADADGSNQRKMWSQNYPRYYTDVEWSPDGKIITSVVVEGGLTAQIMGFHLEEGSERSLFDLKWSSEYGSDTEWLSDGSGLILTQEKEGRRQIFHISYPKGELRPVTNDLNNYGGVSLSSDSKSLVTTNTSYTSALFVASSAAPDAVTQLTSGSLAEDGGMGVSWTVDGKLIYSSQEPSGEYQIWQMNQNGSDRKRITTGKPSKFYPVQSSDGRFILYMTGEDLQIWLMDSDGGNTKRISRTKYARFPRFSPDSKWLVYSISGTNKQDLLKVAIDGEKEISLASHKFMLGAAVSPDGSQIAYSYNDSQTSNDLFVNIISSEGGVPLKKLKLVLGSWMGGRIHWTPDGRGIAYIRNNEEAVSNIYVQPVDGSLARPLTNFTADQIYNFSWSLDGKQIAYSRGKGIHDIVLIQNLP